MQGIIKYDKTKKYQAIGLTGRFDIYYGGTSRSWLLTHDAALSLHEVN